MLINFTEQFSFKGNKSTKITASTQMKCRGWQRDRGGGGRWTKITEENTETGRRQARELHENMGRTDKLSKADEKLTSQNQSYST